MLVSNFVSSREFKQCAYFKDDRINKLFKCAFKFTAPNYENAIGAFLKTASSQDVLHQNLIDTPQLNPSFKSSRLRYSVRKV